METRSILATATLALATLTMIPEGFGEEVQIGAKREDATASDGIRTDRLTAKQLQTWRSIERIVQAVDGSGRPLHPRLFVLWQWARTSGQVIYVEFVEQKNPQVYRAGFLTVQKPTGRRTARIAVIQLWCWIIEKASVQEQVRRPDGFIPFEGLAKVERYAQVVGHELAHAELQLKDPNYDRLCRELETASAAFLSSRRQNLKSSSYDQTARERLSRIRFLTEQIEKPAQSTEVAIWRELLDGQRLRAAAR